MKLIILLLFLLSKINRVLNDKSTYCYTNLECLDTGCCHDHFCAKSSKCTKINKITYGLVGVAGIIFIGITFLTFFFKMRKTKKSVLALKKIDDNFYLKRKNSNADMFRRLSKKSQDSVKKQ
jgi:hypothetical protein